MNAKFLASVALVVAIAGVLVGLNTGGSSDQPAGATAGTEHYNPEQFYGVVTLGGNVTATSSQGAATYTAAQIREAALIQHTAAAALTATLPASTTLNGFVPKAGDRRTVFLVPITTGITLAGGTGTDLNSASSTKFCVAGTMCRLDFVRRTNTDIEVLLTSGL